MAYENLLYEEKDGIAKITINRPQAMNAISPAMLAELKTAMEQAGNDSTVRIIVLTGAGRAFSAGVDLIALGDRKLTGGKVGDILDIPARALTEVIQRVPKPVIAMVNGFCFTGALEIVLACDLVIAAEEAKLGDTHAKFGLRPSWGMSARLPQAIGLIKAKEMSFTAEAITGQEAERLGLVNEAVPLDELEETVMALAKKIMANSPESLAAHKYLYNEGMRRTLSDRLQLEFGTEFDLPDPEERLKGFRK